MEAAMSMLSKLLRDRFCENSFTWNVNVRMSCPECAHFLGVARISPRFARTSLYAARISSLFDGRYIKYLATQQLELIS